MYYKQLSIMIPMDHSTAEFLTELYKFIIIN